MEFNYIIFNITDKVARISLNRPDVLNSFNREMASEFLYALRECEENKDIRVVVISGQGKGFCAGQDLKEVLPKSQGEKRDLGEIVRTQYNPIIKKIREMHKPVIALIKGVAAGAGANLALMCDFVIADEKASFIQSFSKIGLIPDSGGTFILPRLIGMARATELMFLGNKLNAQKAFDWGLIYKVCSGDDLENELNNLVNSLAEMPTYGLGLTKSLLNQSFGNDLWTQLESEELSQKAAGYSYDYNEGVSAFIEKRQPNFKGE